ncbi:MAG: tRNA (adenine(22)-N(1))-methyltransferase TrmK [Christensenellales bacterium]
MFAKATCCSSITATYTYVRANPILLDERLSAAAELAREALTGMERPVAADIGCDHGFLTAKLLETVPNLTMLASDVSAPSLEKARRLLAARGLSGRATLAVADGLSAIDRLVDAVMILGMGAGTILKIVSEGRDKIGGAALIVQANVDLPLLRGGLAELGFAVQKEIYCRAAGRHYVTMLARAGMVEMPDERHLTLGACADGAQNAEQYDYLAWQRGVRVREMLSQAGTNTPRAKERLLAGGHELNIIAEAIGMGRCTVSDIEKLVGEIAPFELAEEWDNVGLLFGCRNAEVTRVVVALDLTQKGGSGEGVGRAADCDAPSDYVQRRQAGDGRDARGQADARHGARRNQPYCGAHEP